MRRTCELPSAIRVLQELLFEIFEILQMWENVDEDVRRRVQAVISWYIVIYIFFNPKV